MKVCVATSIVQSAIQHLSADAQRSLLSIVCIVHCATVWIYLGNSQNAGAYSLREKEDPCPERTKMVQFGNQSWAIWATILDASGRSNFFVYFSFMIAQCLNLLVIALLLYCFQVV